ncbi:MAG: autotransporter domain-containing protein [Actinobacteria bacterium]|nr:autotransporter domain-containing protein [Actinomycetota bacterium]
MGTLLQPITNSNGTVIFSITTLNATNTYAGATIAGLGLSNGMTAGGTNVFSPNSIVTLSNGAATLINLNGFSNVIGGLAGGTASGIVSLGNQTLTLGNSVSTSCAGTITGTGGVIVKQGSGTFTPTGTNTYSGGTQILAGAISIATPTNIGSGGVTFTGNSSLILNTAMDFNLPISLNNAVEGDIDTDGVNSTISSAISGAGILGKLNSGTLTLTNASNNYSGGTNINAGTLSISAPTHIGTGAITFTGNSTLQITSGMTLSNNVVFNAAVIGTLDTAGLNSTLNGSLTGSGGVTKISTGILTLDGVGTNYAGTTLISIGTWQAGIASAFSANSAVTVSASTTLDLNGFSNTVANLSGAGAVTLGAGTLTLGSDGNSQTFSGSITGSTGGLTKTGAGTFTLSGSSSYSGATQVNQGTYQAGAVNAFAANSVFNVAGTLDLNGHSNTITNLSGAGAVMLGAGTLTFGSDGNSQTFSGSITGSTGGLIKTGAGTFTLNSSSYSGATQVNQGTFQASAANAFAANSAFSVAGTLDLNGYSNTIANLSGAGAVTLGTGTLTFGGDGNSQTFSGSIPGSSGGLTKTGAGTFTLNSSSYSGVTQVNQGIFQAGAANAFAANSAFSVAATLDLNNHSNTIGSLAGAGSVNLGSATLTLGGNGSSTTFSGMISGTGGLVKNGGGTFALTGNNSYTGATTVAGGTLLVNGTVLGLITILSGANLQGSGTVMEVVVDGGGSISPGNSIGTLTVLGDYTGAGGSTYNCEINASGAADLINVGGIATIEGQILNVIPDDGGYGHSTSYTILQTPFLGFPTVFGQFTLVQNSALLSYFLSYTDNEVILTALKLMFPTLPGNAGNMVNYIESLAFSTDPFSDLGQVILAFSNLTEPAITLAADQLTPVATSNLRWVLLDQREAAQSIIQRIQKECRQKACPCPQSDFKWKQWKWKQRHVAECSDRGIGHVWVQPYGQFYSEPTVQQFPGVDANTAGLSFGVDGTFANRFLIGLVTGGATTWYNWKEGFGNGSIDSYYLGVYTSFFQAGFYADLSLLYGKNWIHTKRKIGFVQRAAYGKHPAKELSEVVQVGYQFEVRSVWMEPYFNVSLYQMHESAYKERGAASINLSVASNHTNFYRTELGYALSRPIPLGFSTLSPSFKASWVHKQAYNCPHDMVAAFQNQTITFVTEGDFQVRNFGSVGADVLYETKDHFYIDAAYVGEFSDQEINQTTSVRLGLFF